MFPRIKMVIMLLIIYLLPMISFAQDVCVVKKPQGLRKENPDSPGLRLNTKDRMKWKQVLNWCDECDERAKFHTDDFDGEYGLIHVFPIGDNQYIVDIECWRALYNSEHIFYKVVEHKDTIESRLLKLEQFDFYPAENQELGGVEEPKEEPKGEFVRYTDCLIYGMPYEYEKNPKFIRIENRSRGSGGCGISTLYDISGDSPKVVEFRAKPFCSAESPPVSQWKSYPPEQRAKWRMVTNPIREDWKPASTPACSK